MEPRRRNLAGRAKELELGAPLTALKGLGPRRAQAWREAGVESVRALLAYPPRRHRRFEPATPIAELAAGSTACIRGRVARRTGSGRRGVTLSRFDVRDATGEVRVLLFGPRWLVRAFSRGEEVLVRGEVRERGGAIELVARGWLHEEELAEGRSVTLQPQYSLPDGIQPRQHRRALREALRALDPVLSGRSCEAARIVLGEEVPLGSLFRWLHFPGTEEESAKARRVFALEVAVALQERLARVRRRRALRPGGGIARANEWLEAYLRALPFAATADQRRALAEIAADLDGPRAMSRLLSGDVGSGKSAVAWFPLIVAALGGRQGALLAPTELLARQHAEELARVAARLSLPAPQLVIAASERGAAERAAAAAPLVVGTHRLLSAPIRFRDLAALVVDEQHKFGVRQRSRLFAKGERPDLLLVSATPIPRTLAHTLFGHLDLSVLAQRPFPDRRVETQLLLGEARRGVAEIVRAELRAGGKAFVVCPAIGSPRARAPETVAAERVAPWLARELGGDFRVELLHGRLGSEERLERLAAFARGDARVLVATVIVEVGIDVPDATLAVVLGAERFGVSQLHQIRGRIGRRGGRARCLVVAADPDDELEERLAEFAATDDGFRLAEFDLRRRGPGELLGTLQHGAAAGLYPEALLDPQLSTWARELADSARTARKSVPDKPFEAPAVASTEWIW